MSRPEDPGGANRPRLRRARFVPGAPFRLPLILAILTLAFAAEASTPTPTAAQPAPSGPIRAIPLRDPIRIDGILDEPVWKSPSAAPLIQNDPDNGCPPRQRTDWWIAYDDEALYFACRMYDSAPESISCGLGRRDAWPSSDWIVLNIDTFNDDRTGYEFAVTPTGSIVDEAVYNDGAEDASWDGIWTGGTRVDSLGWSTEMRIPLAQLKFPGSEDQVWGINVSRHIRRYQERDDLMHMPRGSSGYVSLFPDLVGIRGIRPRRRLELLTYGVGKGDFQPVARGNPFRSSSDLRGDLGTDIKWPLTNNMTLNATVNPDFGQVEVDPAVINLSDTETFYDEHRPFFVDDANVFRSGNEGTNSNWNFNWMDPLLFYSRRVGQAPKVSLGSYDYVDVPGTTTILGAAKAAGTAGHASVGILSAWTAREDARLELNGVRSSQVAEPLGNYTVARVLRSGTDGRQGFGLITTNTWRDLSDGRSRGELARDATVLGIDGWTRLDRDGVWALRGYLDGSRITGDASAIDILQRSYQHYYQRPDASHLHYDPARTSLQGWMGRAILNKQSGNVTLNTGFGAVSPGFDANDAGFSSRADVVNWSVATGYRWLEPTRTFRSRGFNLASYYSWDTGWNSDAYGYGFFWNSVFTNYWDLSGNVFYNPPRSSLRATRGGPAMRLPSSREINIDMGSDDRKAFSARLDGDASRQGDGSGSVWGEVSATLRPRSSLSITCSPSYSWSRDHSGWVGTVDDALMTETYGVRYLFSTLTYREASLSTRVDWTFTPQLTLQGYLQPLIGVGDYRGLKELAEARSYRFNRYGSDRGSSIAFDRDGNQYQIDPDGAGPAAAFTLGNPDFNYKSLKVNLVLRWEYQPGSTFFLVWTQNRTDSRDPGDFRLERDVHSLFDAVGDNLIQAKVTKSWGL